MENATPAALDVIVPNLNWRYSGVTATNRTIAPLLAPRFAVAWLGGHTPAGLRRLDARALLSLRRQKSRPIVWHARRNNEMAAGLALRALGWPLKLVFTSAAQRRHTRLTRWLIARMDAVIAPSPASASYLQRNATVILHGVDTERFRPPRAGDVAPPGGPLPARYAIGCFGRVRAQKGTDVFVEAMCRLLPRYPEFCALVVGPVTPEHRGFEAELKARVRRAELNDRIRFLGERPIDELPTWHRRLLIYAFTSRNEGFGLTLLEAMASGVAVVAARAGAAEIVVKHGETGMLTPPGDADALTQAIEPLLRDPLRAAEMGGKARARVLAAFGAETEAERIGDVYSGLLGG